MACLQGILDYYNPQANWLARCFTIEYATWFRIVLPGMSNMGFAIPLGGTTLFCRKQVLEEVGGWDAHNVAEDADLGIRQRSRWLKGYMSTYRVHMRHPLQLWRDLGWRRFIGFQLLFLGALSQFILAPVLWSFWLAIFGFPHPVLNWMGEAGQTAVLAFFVFTECIGLVIGVTAVASRQHHRLIPWVPTLMFYFPLGTAAAYKALFEMLFRPFYWDKTEHGVSQDHANIDHFETPPKQFKA